MRHSPCWQAGQRDCSALDMSQRQIFHVQAQSQISVRLHMTQSGTCHPGGEMESARYESSSTNL